MFTPAGTRVLVLLAASAAIAAAGPPCAAQTSASYRMTEHAFNAAGHPAAGVILTSPSFHVRLDSVGEAAASGRLTSKNYGGEAGFVSGYPPPGEVRRLWFTDDLTINWSPEKSAGLYDLYRGALAEVGRASGGSCHTGSIDAETAIDPASPPIGQGWFYLVTVENRLGEEGTKGAGSSGVERPNDAPCP